MSDLADYATHLPILIKAVEMTKGSILELGMGISTTILEMLCRKNCREVVSYENDPKWYRDFTQYASDYHQIRYTDNWEAIAIDKTHWSVVLIDHRPAKRRHIDAIRLAQNADFVILHDSEPEINRFYRYDRAYRHFKYRYDYTECKPNTTVLSNFYPLTNNSFRCV